MPALPGERPEEGSDFILTEHHAGRMPVLQGKRPRDLRDFILME